MQRLLWTYGCPRTLLVAPLHSTSWSFTDTWLWLLWHLRIPQAHIYWNHIFFSHTNPLCFSSVLKNARFLKLNESWRTRRVYLAVSICLYLVTMSYAVHLISLVSKLFCCIPSLVPTGVSSTDITLVNGATLAWVPKDGNRNHAQPFQSCFRLWPWM